MAQIAIMVRSLTIIEIRTNYKNRDNYRKQDNSKKRRRSSDDYSNNGYNSYYINEVGNKN